MSSWVKLHLSVCLSSDARSPGHQPRPARQQRPSAGTCGLRHRPGRRALPDGRSGRRTPRQEPHDPQQVRCLTHPSSSLVSSLWQCCSCNSFSSLLLDLKKNHQQPRDRSRRQLRDVDCWRFIQRSLWEQRGLLSKSRVLNTNMLMNRPTRAEDHSWRVLLCSVCCPTDCLKALRVELCYVAITYLCHWSAFKKPSVVVVVVVGNDLSDDWESWTSPQQQNPPFCAQCWTSILCLESCGAKSQTHTHSFYIHPCMASQLKCMRSDLQTAWTCLHLPKALLRAASLLQRETFVSLKCQLFWMYVVLVLRIEYHLHNLSWVEVLLYTVYTVEWVWLLLSVCSDCEG